MNTRHVFATPSVQAAKTVSAAAKACGIDNECIHLEARPDIEIERINDARKNVAMDFIPAALRGTTLGAIAGAGAGVIAMLVPFFGLSPMGILVLAGVGALVGTWASSLIGSAIPDDVRRTFAREIDQGQVLVVIDAEDTKLARVDQAAQDAGGTKLSYVANADMA